MGRMKELMINEMNRHIDMTSDLDWNAPTIDGAGYTEADRLADDYYQNQYGQNQLDPAPNEINTDTNLCMWEIKSIKDDCIYKIWAQTYKQALEILPQIEDL